MSGMAAKAESPAMPVAWQRSQMTGMAVGWGEGESPIGQCEADEIQIGKCSQRACRGACGTEHLRGKGAAGRSSIFHATSQMQFAMSLINGFTPGPGRC